MSLSIPHNARFWLKATVLAVALGLVLTLPLLLALVFSG